MHVCSLGLTVGMGQVGSGQFKSDPCPTLFQYCPPRRVTQCGTQSCPYNGLSTLSQKNETVSLV